MNQPIGRNAKCPCGSGKKYKHCCLAKDRNTPPDENDDVFGVYPMSDDLERHLPDDMEETSDDADGETAGDELLFPGEHLEHIEHGIAEAMKSSGVDPAMIYAFEETGLIVSEENQHLISEADLAKWQAAIDRFRSKGENEILSFPKESISEVDDHSCWSCRKTIPEQAQRCPHCEAEVEPTPSPEDAALLMDFFQQMDPSVMQEIGNLIETSESGEEFVNLIMVGPCPTCDSENTGDCENDPEIEDPCIGRCFDCGQYFCCDCEDLFDSSKSAVKHECPAWEEMERRMEKLDDDLEGPYEEF